MQLLDSINREQKSDQDRLDNEGRKKTDIENKHKQKGHMRDEALKRVEKLEEHIKTSEAALEDQKKMRADLQSDVGTSKDKIQNLQRELESISEQLGDAKVDKHEVSRTKKKTEIVENFKRLFPGVVSNEAHSTFHFNRIKFTCQRSIAGLRKLLFLFSTIECTICVNPFIKDTTLQLRKCLANIWKLLSLIQKKQPDSVFSTSRSSISNLKHFFPLIIFKQSH